MDLPYCIANERDIRTSYHIQGKEQHVIGFYVVSDLPDEVLNEAVDGEERGVIEAEVRLDDGQRDGRRGVGRGRAQLRRGRAHGGRAARPRP